MAQQIRALVINTKGTSSDSRTHMMEIFKPMQSSKKGKRTEHSWEK